MAWGARVALVPAPAPALYVGLSVLGCAVLAWLAGRAALWSDLDHSSSRATIKWGPVSRLLHRLVEAWSCAVYDMSATDKDKRAGSFRNHRGLTHFAVTAVALGVALGCGAWQLTLAEPSLTWGIVTGGLVAGYVSVKMRSDYWGLLALLVVGSAVTLLGRLPPGVDVPSVAVILGWGVGLAVTAGMLAHDLGDAATKAGSPLLWPFRIDGRRYYPVHIRRKAKLTRTTANSPTERRIRGASWTLLAVAVLGWVPGLYWSVLDFVGIVS